jgi:hypothetical protein
MKPAIASPPRQQDPEPGHAGHEKHPAPDRRRQHGLAEIRLRHQKRRDNAEQDDGEQIAGISGWRDRSENSHAQITTKAGFMNSDG